MLKTLDHNQVILWGFQPVWFNKFMDLCKDKSIRTIFGDPNHLFGIVDTSGYVSTVTANKSSYHTCQADTVVYCSHLQSIFVLWQGTLKQYKEDTVSTIMTGVLQISGSNAHILISTDQGIYGLGSNRLSQLGMDIDSYQEVTEPILIDVFSGLGKITDMACGPFHSAVVVEGDLYTFGWHKDGRLGREEMDLVGLAIFMDQGEMVEVNVVQVACGSSFMLVLDDGGSIWSCGSSNDSL